MSQEQFEKEIAKLIAGYLDDERLNESLRAFLNESPHRENGLDDYVFLKPLENILKDYKEAKKLIRNCDSELKSRLPKTSNLSEIIRFLLNEVIRNLPETPIYIEECPICLEELLEASIIINHVRVLPCTHSFHTSCIETWLRNKSTCPYCRQIVT